MKSFTERLAELIEIGVKGYAAGGLLNKKAYLDIVNRQKQEIAKRLPKEHKEVMDSGLVNEISVGRNQAIADIKKELEL